MAIRLRCAVPEEMSPAGLGNREIRAMGDWCLVFWTGCKIRSLPQCPGVHGWGLDVLCKRTSTCQSVVLRHRRCCGRTVVRIKPAAWRLGQPTMTLGASICWWVGRRASAGTTTTWWKTGGQGGEGALLPWLQCLAKNGWRRHHSWLLQARQAACQPNPCPTLFGVSIAWLPGQCAKKGSLERTDCGGKRAACQGNQTHSFTGRPCAASTFCSLLLKIQVLLF